MLLPVSDGDEPGDVSDRPGAGNLTFDVDAEVERTERRCDELPVAVVVDRVGCVLEPEVRGEIAEQQAQDHDGQQLERGLHTGKREPATARGRW